MAKRGRPAKIQISDDDRLEELILKMYSPVIGEDGEPKRNENGDVLWRKNEVPLTLEEIQFLMAKDTRFGGKTYSLMGLQKIEQRALVQLRPQVEKKLGIKDMSDCDFVNDKCRAPAREVGLHK